MCNSVSYAGSLYDTDAACVSELACVCVPVFVCMSMSSSSLHASKCV